MQKRQVIVMTGIRKCPQASRKTERRREGAEDRRGCLRYNAHILNGHAKKNADTALEVAIE